MKKNLITSFLLGAGFLSMAAPLLAAGNQPDHRLEGARTQNVPAIEGCAIGLRLSAEGWTCSPAPPPAPPPMATPQLPVVVGFTVRTGTRCKHDWETSGDFGMPFLKTPFLKTRFGTFVGQGGGDGGGCSGGSTRLTNFSCVPGATESPSYPGINSGATYHFSDGTSRANAAEGCPAGTGPVILSNA